MNTKVFRYVKSENMAIPSTSNDTLFRSNSCTCTGMINKLTDLLEIKCPHNHDAAAHKSDNQIIISNTD